MRRFLAGVATAVVVAAGALSGAVPAHAAPQPFVPIVNAAGDLLVAPTPGKADRALKGTPGPKGDGQTRRFTSNTNRALLAGPYFYYAIAQQALASGESANSLAANLHIENAFLDTARGDAHTLGEIAVRSHDSQQTIEVGTTVDPAVCGAGNSPCVFVFHWRNGVPQCYNGCGFVQYNTYCNTAGAICAGDSNASHVGTAKRFQILYSGTSWWIAYNGQWIGYFPGSLWTGSTPSVSFTYGGLFQGFYEVAAAVQNTCSDMGNGLIASNTSSARVGSISMTGTLPGAITNNFPASTQNVPASPVVYTAATVTATTIRGGGPGWNAAGTAAGTTGSC